jgi:CHAT domain-containing protein
MNSSFFSRRWTSVLLFALCLTLLCRRETPVMMMRTTEPRLTGYDTWRPCAKSIPRGNVVAIAACGAPNDIGELARLAESDCEDNMETEADAVRLLADAPKCTSAAVEKLETLVVTQPDASTWSDLAAAYYIRAQKKDRPSDFVRSLAAADRAVALNPIMTAARFNRALAQEALGFSDAATESWDTLSNDGTPWAKEAKGHRAHLMTTRSLLEATRWNEDLLRTAAEAGDRAAIQQLIEPYLKAAQRYVEENVLRAWALASSEKATTRAAEELQVAERIASALAKLTHDRYLLDAVERIQKTDDVHTLELLKEGHRVLATARMISPGDTKATEATYARAEKALAAAGSPLRLGAMLGRANFLSQLHRDEEALALFRSVEQAADEGRYPNLLGRVHAGRGYLLTTQGRYIDALAEYFTARTTFEQTRDLENVGVVQTSIAGLFRRIGHQDLAWRASFQNQSYVSRLVEPEARHLHLGENAVAAVEIGYPSVGLQYQNLAVRMLEGELSSNHDEERVARLRSNLGVALYTRAWIHARLRDNKAAQADLDASTLRMTTSDAHSRLASIPDGYRARIAEVEAQTLAGTDHRRAIAKLSQAIRLASKTYYQTLGASLRIQRAQLYELEGNRAAAVEDLKTGIALLQAEEKAVLATPEEKRPKVEQLWSSYFARSQEAYRLLVRYYVDDGKAETEAFQYAERARAYEPLHLVLRRKDLPAAFRDLIHDGEPLRLDAVKAILPRGTFLLHYSVQDDRTYVWIIGNGSSTWRTLPIGEGAISAWTHALHRYADQRNEEKFTAALSAPYKALLEGPLAVVETLQDRGTRARIVVVPDRSMHGLPFAALGQRGRHLIEDHPVSVAGSATLYAFSLAQDHQMSQMASQISPMSSSQQSVLLFADPTIDEQLGVSGGQGSLMVARSEVEQIRDLYASVAHVDPPRMGNDATVQEFLRRSAESTIVHIAAHGIANPDVPSQSYLLLARTENDRGILDVERMLKELKLTKTRLAVLSACSSAGGTPVGPEGLAPLVRPLIAAGIPGVVGTLWDVSDNTATEHLLVRFHQHYRDGEDAENALRHAQIEMIHSKSKSHQAAWSWSAYQMIGYASSPFPRSAAQTTKPK